ncbi:MAG: hypothetical protein P1U70_17680, partial [Saprospiraceae bacterium]|nr:hypothetical protein [Saprospiraceae bacterium]
MEKEHLLKLLSEDKLDKIFENWFNIHKNSKSSSFEIVLIQGDYYDLRDREKKGTIRPEEIQVRKSQIRERLLNLIKSPNKKTIFTSTIEDYFSAPFDQLASFKMTLDLGVARYMGKVNGFLNSVFSAFSDRKNSDRDEGHSTNSFDWDGSSVWTTCDSRLAVNIWTVNSGDHYLRAEGSQESYTTYLVSKCGTGAVFGNGNSLFISDSMGRVSQEIRNYDTNYDLYKMCVDKETGLEIISLEKKSDELALLFFKRKSFSGLFEYSRMKINVISLNNEGYTDWGIKRKPIKDTNQAYTFMYGTASNEAINRKRDIFLINNSTKELTAHQTLSGIQAIAISANQNKIAVLGKDLSILNSNTLEVEQSIELPIARIDHEKGVLAYSSCGRFLAISYSSVGDVEIRDANHFNIIYSL